MHTSEVLLTPIVNAAAVQDYESSGVTTIVTTDETGNVAAIPVATISTDVELGNATPEWRDVPFAMLFLINLTVMVWLGISKAPRGLKYMNITMETLEDEMRKSDDVTEEDIHEFESFLDQAFAYMEVYPVRIFFYLVVPCCILAFVYGLIGTTFILKPCPNTMIYLCLLSSLA